MKKVFYLLATAMLAFACGDDDNVTNPTPGPGPGPDPEPPVEESISLSAESYKFPKTGGPFDVTVTSSGDWELVATGNDDNVFTPSAWEGKTGAKVTFTAKPNTTSEEIPEATFTFICGEKRATFKASQYAGDELTIETTSLSAPVTGGSLYVTVKASGEFACEITEGKDWLSLPTAAEPSSRAVETTQFELKAAANTTGKSRTAKALFTLGDLEPVEVTVTQAQNDVLKVAEETNLNLEAVKAGETLTFTFQANFKPSVKVLVGQEFLTPGEPTAVSDEEGVVDYTLSIEVKPNDGEPRSGSLRIFQQDNEETMKIDLNVAQAGESKLPEGQVNIPDANFRTKLLALGYIVSADAELCELTDEGKNATQLNVGNSNITDLTGLEAFQNVTNLMVFGNRDLTRVDLSRNPKITVLNTNICPALNDVDLGEANIDWVTMNSLTSSSVVVRAKGKIKELDMNGSQFTSLDVSQVYNVGTVNLNKCSRLDGTLDLRNCAAITKLQISSCSSLKKVILPKSVEGKINIVMNEEVVAEFVYE